MLDKVKAFLDEKAKDLGPGIPDFIVATIKSNLRQTGIQNSFRSSRLKMFNSEEEKLPQTSRMWYELFHCYIVELF